MTKWRRKSWGVLMMVAVVGMVAWWMTPKPERIIQGKRESEWIKSIQYNGDEEETKQWRALGANGIEMLVNALKKGNGRLERSYVRIWPRLPAFLQRKVPRPVDTAYSTRMAAANLLCRLGKDAKSAVPGIVQAIKVERADSVRLVLIGFFEDDVLGGMEKAKRQLLPELIRAMTSDDSGLRNNAAVALYHYTDQAKVVVPVLVKALHDEVPKVRLLAAKALDHVDPQVAVKAGAVRIVIVCLGHPNIQVSGYAANLLGEMGKEPGLAVPALIEKVQSTNSHLAWSAAYALGRFKTDAKEYVPVLKKALEGREGRGRAAIVEALKQLGAEDAK